VLSEFSPLSTLIAAYFKICFDKMLQILLN